MTPQTVPPPADRPDDPADVPPISRWEDEDPPGTTGGLQHNDPESIAAWIAEFRALPVPDMTDEEYAALKLIIAEQRLAGMEAMKARVEALKRCQS